MFFESDTLGDGDFDIYASGSPVWTGGATQVNPIYYGNGGYGSVPSYNPAGSGINWNSMWNSIFGVGSQAIAAWGQNPSQQVGNVPGIGQGYSPAAINQSQAAIQAAIAQQQAALGLNNPRNLAGGGIAEDAFGGITNFISRNPIAVAGLAFGAYLLMREPPRRR